MTTHTPRASFEPGSIVGGRYRIVSLIGVGGVGRVYLARHIELDTEVAIKVLRPEMTEREEAVQRFGREARASVRLRSERIARVFDVGTQEGTPYFVMEYMLGCDLLELRRQGSTDLSTLAEFFIQACEGLADAHAQGVVHRDIKPENLFIVRDANGWRTLKIFDFGISKFSLTGKYSDVDLAAKRTEVMMGTPHYISPEQIRSTRDVDHRTDLWSLGVVMFEVLSNGILPFREEREVTALIAEVLEKPHRSLLDVAPNVPEGLAAIVDRCLVKDREARYQSAAEIAVDLLPFAPVRARASAERAVSAMQSAGLMALNADLSLRPSQPPPRSSQPPVSDRSHAVTPLARTQSEPPQPVEASQIIDEEDFRPRRRWSAPLVLALLGVGVLAFAGTTLVHRPVDEAAPSEAAHLAAAPILAPPVTQPAPVNASAPAVVHAAPQASAQATSEAPKASSAPKPSVVPPRAAVAYAPRALPPRPVAVAPQPAKPVVSVSTPPASQGTKLDLRRER
ncbi:MAG: protein kinase domain-containing protein [Myxococcota bacterium]